jgi:hypothetical protein
MGGETVPTAFDLSTSFGTQACPSCGVERSVFQGDLECDIHNGVAWPDAIGIRSWPAFLVSSRVVRAVRQLGQPGFAPMQVQWKRDTSRTAKPPDYFLMDVSGTIDIDRAASGLGDAEHCSQCFSYLGQRLIEAKRYVPLFDTWSGSQVFRMRNNPNLETFCTQEVLELARNEQWSNMRFEPMDVVRKHAIPWRGIDYLGMQWPPETWYPPSPFAHRSLAEWVADLPCDAPSQYIPAHQALIEIGAPAIPDLSRLLLSDSAKARKRSARVLALIHSRHEALPPAIKKRVAELMQDDPDFLSALSKR